MLGHAIVGTDTKLVSLTTRKQLFEPCAFPNSQWVLYTISTVWLRDEFFRVYRSVENPAQSCTFP